MEDRKTELIRVKCTPDMLKRIEDEATAQRRDFADMVRLLIVDGLAAQARTLINKRTVYGPGSGYMPWQHGDPEATKP